MTLAVPYTTTISACYLDTFESDPTRQNSGIGFRKAPVPACIMFYHRLLSLEAVPSHAAPTSLFAKAGYTRACHWSRQAFMHSWINVRRMLTIVRNREERDHNATHARTMCCQHGSLLTCFTSLQGLAPAFCLLRIGC